MFRIIYIKESEKLSLKLDNLIIENNNNEYKLPLEDIDTIMLENNKCLLTSKLICKMMEYKINFIVCNDKMMPTGIMLPYQQHSRGTKIILNQIAWTNELKDFMWDMIIENKIKNQRKVLEMYNKNQSVINKIKEYEDLIDNGDITNREGHAAKIYFSALFGKDFTRFNDDTINGGLNYGYTILRTNICRIIVASGLIPNIGIHHKNEFNNYNLADDLIEVFRPIVDMWCYKNLTNKEYLSREDRMNLINLLNGTIDIGNTNQTLTNAFQKYLDGLINFTETGDINKIIFPKIETFKENEQL